MRLLALLVILCGLAISGCCGAGVASDTDAYTRGAADLDRKNYAAAAEELRQAEAAAPGTTNALALRAKALLQLGQLAEAEGCLTEFLKHRPSSADATYLLAYLYFRQNEAKRSLVTYTQAARLQRPTADDLKIVGLDYVLLNDYPDALRWLERSVAEDPLNAEATYHLGRAYYVQNQFEKAIAAFERALQLNPNYVKAEDNLGLAYSAQNREADAEAAYRKAIQMSVATGSKSQEPYLNLADLLSHTAKRADALTLLDRAEQMSGRSAKIAEIRGRVLLEEGRPQEAEAAFRSALLERPKAGGLHYLLARALKQQGKMTEANSEFAETKMLLGSRSAEVN